MTKGIQARNIIRAAKRMGVELRRSNFQACAVGVLARSLGKSPYDDRDDLANNVNQSVDNIVALEMGFENWTPDNHSIWVKNDSIRQAINNAQKNRYYKVGRNVARLAGLG